MRKSYIVTIDIRDDHDCEECNNIDAFDLECYLQDAVETHRQSGATEKFKHFTIDNVETLTEDES